MSHGLNKIMRCNHDGQPAFNFEVCGIVGFKMTKLVKKESGPTYPDWPAFSGILEEYLYFYIVLMGGVKHRYN